MNLQQRWCDLTVAQWLAVDRGLWLFQLVTNLFAGLVGAWAFSRWKRWRARREGIVDGFPGGELRPLNLDDKIPTSPVCMRCFETLAQHVGDGWPCPNGAGLFTPVESPFAAPGPHL